MPLNIENYIPGVKYNGLNTDLASDFAGTTIDTSGNLNVAGSTTFTGGQVRSVTQSALVGATVVLTASQSGGVFINRSTSGSPSWTLPTNVAGLTYTFCTANTTAGFTVTGGTIKAKANPAGAAITGTTLTNTQGTATVGDTITLVADGTNWMMTAQGGTFAAA